MSNFVKIGLTIALIFGGLYLYNQNRTVGSEEEVVGVEPIPVEGILTYSGVLPCADCEGIGVSLTLMDRGDGQGGAFSMTETYLGEEDAVFESTGQWEVETKEVSEGEEAQVYVLTSEEMSDFQTREYEIVDKDTIRLLDQEGKRTDSELPYDLELQS